MSADLVNQKVWLAGAFVASTVAPVAELGFIGLLYAVVDADQRGQLLRFLENAGLKSLVGSSGFRQEAVVLGIAAGVLLVIAVAAKYAFGYLHARFLLAGYIAQSRRVVEAYLFATPERTASIERGRVANAAMSESFQYAKVMFALLDAVANGVAVVIFLAAAFRTSIGLMSIAAGLGLLTLLITRRGYALQRRVGARRVEVQGALVGSLWEILNSYITVKVEAGERRLLARFTDDLRSKQTWRLEKTRNELFIKVGTESVLYVSLLAIVIVATFVLRSDAALVLVFLVMMGRLQKYLGQLQNAWIEVQHALPSVEMMTQLLDTCTAGGLVAPPDTDQTTERVPFKITFDSVSFAYAPDRPVLDSLDLTIVPGDRVLIQGPSGQGKSTLLYLACGLVRPTGGTIVINSEPLTDEVFYRVRPTMTYVAPNGYLLRGSIRQNLCLGVDYGDSQIRAAVERARLGSLIDRLPEGIDGDIGDDGSNLSLGERQRVMLARIFLKNPLLILLDEATANLDLDNERQILTDLFDAIDPSAIVLMVTHRAPAGLDFTQTLDLIAGRVTARASLGVTAG